MIKKKKSKKER